MSDRSDELAERAFEAQESRAYARWAAAPLFSLGFLSPVPFAIAYTRTHLRAHAYALAFWVMMLTALVVSAVIAGSATSDVVGVILIANWLGAPVHTIAIRKQVGRATALANDPQLNAAERHVDRRKRALQIAQRDPRRALELGIGRPDVEGSFDGGLIDVNHAPPAVLERLPGIDAAHARRVVELRMNGTGFVSVEDLGMVLDLDPGDMHELALRAVFLPRVLNP